MSDKEKYGKSTEKTPEPKTLFIVITGNQGGPKGREITYLRKDMLGETTFLPHAAVLNQDQLDHFNALRKDSKEVGIVKKITESVNAVEYMQKRVYELKNALEGMSHEKMELECLIHNVQL